jgi:hypothetical protein
MFSNDRAVEVQKYARKKGGAMGKYLALGSGNNFAAKDPNDRIVRPCQAFPPPHGQDFEGALSSGQGHRRASQPIFGLGQVVQAPRVQVRSYRVDLAISGRTTKT